ncbi:MAG: hypothetical protein KKI08_22005 [Armatimonadetes bacterium]|nr:hypothetical protein [Armatimonadota bacterium]
MRLPSAMAWRGAVPLAALACCLASARADAPAESLPWLQDGRHPVAGAARVGDYAIRVLRAHSGARRQLRFEWGLAPPGLRSEDKAVTVELEAVPLTAEAALRLSGMQLGFRGVWDNGAQAVARPPGIGGGPQSAYLLRPGGSTYVTIPHEYITFSYPSPDVTKFARLEGALALRPSPVVHELRLGPRDVGQALHDGDLTVTLEKWESAGEDLTVTLSLQSPALASVRPDEVNYHSPPRLVGCPRTSSHPIARSGTLIPGGLRAEYSFTGVTAASALQWTFIDPQPYQVTCLPFTLTDIPLPEMAVPVAIELPPLASPVDSPVESAPWVGSAPITVHFKGTLRAALAELERQSHVEICGPFRRVSSHKSEPFAPSVAVRLDGESAPLNRMLLSLCRQAGLVYVVYTNQNPYLFVRQGDLNLDSRPTARCGEYRVRVRSVTRSWSRKRDLQAGPPLVTGQAAAEGLSLNLETEARTQPAALRVGGVDPTLRLTFDRGPACEATAGGYKGSRFKFVSLFNCSYGRQLSTVAAADLSLPPPPPGASMIRRLEGKLWLYPDARATTLHIPAASEGRTVQQDGVTVMVSKWRHAAGAVQVELTFQFAAGGGFSSGLDRDRDWVTAELYGQDGRKFDGAGGGGPLGADGLQYRYVFSGGTSDPDHLELHVLRRPPADRAVPFAIEGVPLP